MLTSTMENGDSYNKNSEAQRQNAIRSVERLLDRGINGIHQYGSSDILDDSICIVDYGAAGGKNSIEAVDFIIQRIIDTSSSSSKNQSTDSSSSNDKMRSCTVVYNDQPTNDWTVAIDTIINNKDSYIHKQYSIPLHFHTLFSPQSFYEQVCADNSVTIGFSNAAMQLLSSIPCHLKNNVVSYGSIEGEWKEQAREDWGTLLTHRYHELKHGGIFLVNMIGLSGDDDPMCATGAALYAMFQRFVSEGLMSEEQLSNYSFPNYARTLDEILEPIEKQVNGIQFRVLNPDVNSILVYTEHPTYRAYRDVHHDPHLFGKQMIGWYRAVFSNAQLHACDGKKEQSDILFQRWEEEIAKEPETWSTAINWAAILLQKVSLSSSMFINIALIHDDSANRRVQSSSL
jgi:hypothetical protein